MKQKIIIGIIAVLVLIQLKRIDKENPPIEKTLNFVDLVDTPEPVKKILVKACYDCHTYETKYPWYTNIAPVSWWIEDHIEDGRRHFNLSNWGNYSYKKQDHKLEELIEMIDEKIMPLENYLSMHPEAELTDAQRKLLIEFTKELRTKLKP